MGQFGIGQGVRRLEDQRFLTGEGRYTDDIVVPRQCHAFFVRSPFAHAAINTIDIQEATNQPGVLGVYTAEDLTKAGVGDIPCLALMTGRDGQKVLTPPYPALARERVHHVGDTVALVVAETFEQAQEAAELVEVDYDPLPAVADLKAALEPDAPVVQESLPSNLCLDWAQGNESDVDAAFAKADHVARIELVNNRIVVNSMEPRALIADYDPQEDKFTLHAGSQGIYRLKDQLCQNIFNIPADKLRVITPDVGGGFGMKIFAYPEQVACLFAARELGRPVRWTGGRNESFQSDTQGRDHLTTAEMALDKDGHFLGIRVSTLANLGAYLSNFAPYIPTGASTQMYSGLYRIPAIHAEVKCVLTNTVPVDAYRGAGRPEASYVMERLVDEAARVVGLDRGEIRIRNFIRPEDLPYDTGLNRVYDSGDYPRLLKEACRQIDWEGFESRRAESRSRGMLRGIGLASYVEACGGMGEEEARISLDPDGGVTLVIGTMTNGQGHHTAYAQLLHDKFGLPLEKIRMVQGDSETVHKGGGTGGSRSLLMGGVSAQRAADRVIEKARQVAGDMLEASAEDIEFDDGLFRIAGTDRSIELSEIARRTHEGAGNGVSPIEETDGYKAEALTFPNGCHVCEIEVDPDTGCLRIVDYVVVDDFGTVVNPMLAAGQVHGGVAQGLGQALLEHTVYDEEGQLITASFMDYAMPRADDMPEVKLTLVEDMPCKTNPMGVKGAGEAGAIGAPPAIMNALLDALIPAGVKRIDMPATSEQVWRALQGASTTA
ncbi:xanthine dehydrogenase family protein molybdopterin-binding subunit [Fodinicurvata sediminis]|uniref:xanthine dehydrogenase family protein molybdopterin-binding subunit n=1 Tax=Fodinicurvata sediminis TaxID=1121832 RepID=UPI0003B5BAD6|nr:xanthine dehydrogenase family protein molybdopterin-binding subunit [Fodinicurvata sediminis]